MMPTDTGQAPGARLDATTSAAFTLLKAGFYACTASATATASLAVTTAMRAYATLADRFLSTDA